MTEKWIKDLNRHLSKGDKQKANKHLKRHSQSHVIREMHILAAKKYYYTPITMPKPRTSQHQMLARMWNKRSIIHCWWECSMAQVLWNTVSYKAKHTFTIHSSNCTPWYLPKGTGHLYHTNNYMYIFIAALFLIAKT